MKPRADQHHRLTSTGYPPRVYDPTARVPYLCVCAVYQNEAPYLKEWIEFHRLVGVERFFLYDNNSTDFHLDVLKPYIEDDIVVLHDWPVYPQGQLPAYEHCLREHLYDARWVAFIDLDEFLFSPTGEKVSNLLVPYQYWPGVGVNNLSFGTSGHRTRPEGLVIENYLYRTRNWNYNGIRKMIVHAARVVGCAKNNPHHFLFRDGFPVDENEFPLNPHTKFCSFNVFRINHYWTKSEEEARAKFARLRGDRGEARPWEHYEHAEQLLTEVRDETILSFVPALREAMNWEP